MSDTPNPHRNPSAELHTMNDRLAAWAACTAEDSPSLIERFEAAHACKVAAVWGTAPQLVKRLQAGEKGDVLLLNRAGVDTMLGAGSPSRAG